MTRRVALLGLAVLGAAIVAEHEVAAQRPAPPSLMDWSTDGGDIAADRVEQETKRS